MKRLEKNLNEILNTPNDSEYGSILEVDLHYSEIIHDAHQDFLRAPTKEEKFHKFGRKTARSIGNDGGNLTVQSKHRTNFIGVRQKTTQFIS